MPILLLFTCAIAQNKKTISHILHLMFSIIVDPPQSPLVKGGSSGGDKRPKSHINKGLEDSDRCDKSRAY